MLVNPTRCINVACWLARGRSTKADWATALEAASVNVANAIMNVNRYFRIRGVLPLQEILGPGKVRELRREQPPYVSIRRGALPRVANRATVRCPASKALRSAQLSSWASMVILAFRRREIGQPSFAFLAAASNLALSAPGIFTLT